MTLPNGKFLLIFDGMPEIGTTGAVYTDDWLPAREQMTEFTGAVAVLRFAHPLNIGETK